MIPKQENLIPIQLWRFGSQQNPLLMGFASEMVILEYLSHLIVLVTKSKLHLQNRHLQLQKETPLGLWTVLAQQTLVPWPGSTVQPTGTGLSVLI